MRWFQHTVSSYLSKWSRKMLNPKIISIWHVICPEPTLKVNRRFLCLNLAIFKGMRNEIKNEQGKQFLRKLEQCSILKFHVGQSASLIRRGVCSWRRWCWWQLTFTEFLRRAGHCQRCTGGVLFHLLCSLMQEIQPLNWFSSRGHWFRQVKTLSSIHGGYKAEALAEWPRDLGSRLTSALWWSWGYGWLDSWGPKSNMDFRVQIF